MFQPRFDFDSDTGLEFLHEVTEEEGLTAAGDADADYDGEEEVLRHLEHVDDDDDEASFLLNNNVMGKGSAEESHFPTFSVSAGDATTMHTTVPLHPYTVSPVLSAYSVSPNPNEAGSYTVTVDSPTGNALSGYAAPAGGAMMGLRPYASQQSAPVHYTESPSFVPQRSPPYTAFVGSGVAKPPPPTYEVASSTNSLHARSSEVSPISGPLPYFAAQPATTAHHDTFLVRNKNGVFLLQPAMKPAPPYTPPAGLSGVAPPSPLPQYKLPPPAAVESKYTVSGGMYTQSISTCVPSTASYTAAPPPPPYSPDTAESMRW